MSEPRGDFLASVCLVDEGEALRVVLTRVAAITGALERRFTYFELVCVVGRERRAELDAVADRLAAMRNLRVIVTDNGLYRSRFVAAREAIGDVVAITDLSGLTPDELLERMTEAFDTGTVLVGMRPSARLSPLRAVLSLISRHRINATDSRTMILPREPLNALLIRPAAVLDLRFEPKLGPPRYRRFPLRAASRHRPAVRARLRQSYELLTLVVMSGAPRYLKGFAALGMLVAAAAVAYGFYAVLVILFASQVERGWFSTSIVQAGSVGFVAVGLSIVCLAVASIHERLAGTGDDDVVAEIANVSFFEKLDQRIVELDAAHEPAPREMPPQPGAGETFTRVD